MSKWINGLDRMRLKSTLCCSRVFSIMPIKISGELISNGLNTIFQTSRLTMTCFSIVLSELPGLIFAIMILAFFPMLLVVYAIGQWMIHKLRGEPIPIYSSSPNEPDTTIPELSVDPFLDPAVITRRRSLADGPRIRYTASVISRGDNSLSGGPTFAASSSLQLGNSSDSESDIHAHSDDSLRAPTLVNTDREDGDDDTVDGDAFEDSGTENRESLGLDTLVNSTRENTIKTDSISTAGYRTSVTPSGTTLLPTSDSDTRSEWTRSPR